MKKTLNILALGFLSLSAPAFAADAPVEINRASYGEWLDSIGSVTSPYLEPVFDWFEEQATKPFPAEVAIDPDHILVSVERPLQETIEAEEMGDVEKGVTYGLESYLLIDAPVNVVLETILFRWGKPIGATSGVTYPIDNVYSYRQEKLEPFWGQAYRTETVLRGGGFAKDQNDVCSLVVRGNNESGYILVGSFFGPNGRTASTSSLTVITMNPTADGKTEYRVSARYTGQSYMTFGLEFGRRNYGFNVSRIRQGQKDFMNMVQELKNTGKISERLP